MVAPNVKEKVSLLLSQPYSTLPKPNYEKNKIHYWLDKKRTGKRKSSGNLLTKGFRRRKNKEQKKNIIKYQTWYARIETKFKLWKFIQQPYIANWYRRWRWRCDLRDDRGCECEKVFIRFVPHVFMNGIRYLNLCCFFFLYFHFFLEILNEEERRALKSFKHFLNGCNWMTTTTTTTTTAAFRARSGNK